MEIHDKLSHLSDEELSALLDLYCDGSMHVSEIIEKYKIDVTPAKLVKLLPPIKTETVCDICGEYMYMKIFNRDISYQLRTNKKYCINCHHSMFSDWRNKQCTCVACMRKREDVKKADEKGSHLFNKSIPKKMQFNELGFDDQVKLLYLIFRYSKSKNIQVELIDGKALECIGRMLAIDAISIAENNELPGVSQENLRNYHWNIKINYEVNVDIDNETWLLIRQKRYFIEKVGKEEIIKLMKYYMYCDLIEKYRKMLDDRHIELYISQPADDKFIDLLDVLSYSQILYLCRRVAKTLWDKIAENEMTTSGASKIALANVSRFYSNAVKWGWKLYRAELEDIGNELSFYVKWVMNKDLDILDEVVSVEMLGE